MDQSSFEKKKFRAAKKNYVVEKRTDDLTVIRLAKAALGDVQILPRFAVKGKAVVFGNRSLDLERRPMSLRLIRIFSDLSVEATVAVDHLVGKIYEGFSPENKSSRFKEVLRHNVVKLISRTRASLNQTFEDPEEPWIEFLPYDDVSQTWQFFRLRNQYLFKKEKTIAHFVSAR